MDDEPLGIVVKSLSCMCLSALSCNRSRIDAPAVNVFDRQYLKVYDHHLLPCKAA